MTDFTDLNDAFGKALLQQFFEPVLIHRMPDGTASYAPSGVAVLAQSMFAAHGKAITEEVWAKIDLEALCEKIANQVVDKLTAQPSGWSVTNTHAVQIRERVNELVAEQLGKKAVEQVDMIIQYKS